MRNMTVIRMMSIASLVVPACVDGDGDLLDDTAQAVALDSSTATTIDLATAIASGATVIERSSTGQAVANAAPIVVGHRCNELRGDGSTEGVHCADVAFVDTATGWEIWPVGQAFCQTVSGGALRQCAGIRQNVGLYNPGAQLSGQQVNCGRFGGSACPATVRFQHSSPHVRLPAIINACYEIWASMVDDRIVLPVSARPLGPGPNVASAHIAFCATALKPQPTPQP
jgi:hypothetical protein